MSTARLAVHCWRRPVAATAARPPCARTFSSSPSSPSSSCRHGLLLVQAGRASIRQHIRALEQRRAGRLPLSTSAARRHGHLHTPQPGQERHVTFVDKDGDEHTFVVADGDNLLDIAQANDLEMEGACGGSCACSTCHVIVDDSADADMYDRIPEATDDENDMLDLAFGLTETSRLGCQVHMSKELDGLRVRLPAMTRNLQAGDFEKR